MQNHFRTFIGATMLSGLLASTLISCTDGKGETAKVVRKADPIPVKILVLETTEHSTSILTSGRITTDNETVLAFKTGGVIDEVFVEEGDKVRKGQVLATLNLREVNAVVSQAKLLVEKSQRDFKRMENLYQDSVATLEQMQNAKTALDVAKEQLHAANFNKKYSSIVALEDGFILKKFVNPGQVVGIGDPVLLANGVSNNAWILKVNVTDKQWSAIRENNTAIVKLDAFADKEFRARVLRKSESSDPATGTFTVDLLVENQREKLVSGMFGSAAIHTGQTRKVWSVPYEAVLDANGNEGFVFVTSDYKTAVRKPVIISSIEKDRVSLTSGMEGYPALIVSGSAYLTDSSAITIIK